MEVGLAFQSVNRFGPGGLTGSFWHQATRERKKKQDTMNICLFYVCIVATFLIFRKSSLRQGRCADSNMH